MNKTARNLLALTLSTVAAAGFYLWQQGSAHEPPLLQPVETPRLPVPAAVKPAEHYPIPESQDAQAEPNPLPALNESDLALRDGLSGLFGQASVKKFFHPKEIVRHIVVTIDNLPRKTVAARLLPVKPVDGKFRISGSGKSLFIGPENAMRYMLYVHLAEMVDTKKLVAVYVRFYPLFQRAYQDLGYPNGYFNNRLVAVIDHLLAAPEIEGPLALTQPHVLYEFADPDLELRSAGHKIMLRMGMDNAAKIKAKLREIRSEVTAGMLAQ